MNALPTGPILISQVITKSKSSRIPLLEPWTHLNNNHNIDTPIKDVIVLTFGYSMMENQGSGCRSTHQSTESQHSADGWEGEMTGGQERRGTGGGGLKMKKKLFWSKVNFSTTISHLQDKQIPKNSCFLPIGFPASPYFWSI